MACSVLAAKTLSSYLLNNILMAISVESRVHRTLRKLDRFKAIHLWDQLPQLDQIASPLGDGERLLGAYENEPGCVDRLLLFTNVGVHCWMGNRWHSLKYVDIEAAEWPQEQKTEAETLVIERKDGSYLRLPVNGGSELGRDLFVVMRFIDRVVAYVSTRS